MREIRTFPPITDLPDPRGSGGAGHLCVAMPVIGVSCRQSFPEDLVRTIPAPGAIPSWNLNSSLSVDSTRVAFFPMMDPRDCMVRVNSQKATDRCDTFGAPGEIRTPDHLVRSQVLYPTELRALSGTRL